MSLTHPSISSHDFGLGWASSSRSWVASDLEGATPRCLRQPHWRLAEFLRALSAAESADVLTSAGAAVTSFLAGWPALKPRMIPRIESPVNVPLCDGKIVLKGRYDLALGPPARGAVIVDLKTGNERPEHPEEVRYYALLETLAQKTPSRRVATYYLDGSWFRKQDVDRGVLEAALRRTAEAVNRIGDLWWRVRDERLTPGPHCYYCAARQDCADGKRWIEESSERDRPRRAVVAPPPPMRH